MCVNNRFRMTCFGDHYTNQQMLTLELRW
uniref:Uncharacterized protein n=1 Tax=Lepeophtheirus salmonis TaxID=72036 RepID=A0A0K2VGF0_LEPSM